MRAAWAALAWFSGIGALALWPWSALSAAPLLTIAGVALWTLAVVVTFAWYFPIDARIRRLPPEAAPAEASSLFARLAQLHALRTGFYAAGFVCFVLGVVLT